MFEMAHLHEDALREYDELELCYLETGTSKYASSSFYFLFLIYFSYDNVTLYMFVFLCLTLSKQIGLLFDATQVFMN